MSESYAKLFSTITASTIWGEPLATRVVWITMLAMADKNGDVMASVPGLARIANVTLEQCEEALKALRSPDPYSRTPEHEGRRIEDVAGGWHLLNYAAYRQRLGREDRREQQRQWVAEKRARQRAGLDDDASNDGRPAIDDVDKSTKSTHTEAEADTEAEAEEQKHGHAPRADACPHEQLIALYHETLPELPEVKAWGEPRRKLLRARWREDEERQSLDWWRKFFGIVRRSPFLLGQTHGGRDPFLANLEWLVKPTNFAKVLEGNYLDRSQRVNGSRTHEQPQRRLEEWT